MAGKHRNKYTHKSKYSLSCLTGFLKDSLLNLVFPPDCQKGQGKLKKGQGILVAEGHSKILIQTRRSLHINIKHIIQILYFCVKAALYL